MTSVEDEVGHPGEMWAALKDRVQARAVIRFSDVATDFLQLIWCLDQYRIRGVPPRAMGDPNKPDQQRLEAVYRGKGNWFADLAVLLLVNRTRSPVAPRSSVQGFSQVHQIDVAWPVRGRPIIDPLVCAETKMTGAPPTRSTPARRAMADWTNRRKELKFAATDLKLYRRQQTTHIDHWDNWRRRQPPLTYFLWCARMAPGDNLDTMVAELRALTDTYLDGAGLFAYRERRDGRGYETVAIPQRHRIAQLDDVLHSIANGINDLAGPDGTPPPPQMAQTTAVDVTTLAPDGAGS